VKFHKRLSALLITVLFLLAFMGSKPGQVVAQGLAATPTSEVQHPFDLRLSLKQYITTLPADFYGIKPEDALKAMQGDPRPFLLDVREPKELADSGYIAGAVNIPLHTLTQNLAKLSAQDSVIFVYCGIGHRGSVAAMTLRLLGYTNVRSIFGGINNWKAAKLPVEIGVPAASTASNSKAPVFDPELYAALDKFLREMPDDYFAVAPTAVLKNMQADPRPFLLDVREPKELADNGTVDSAVNIPLRTLFDSLDKLPGDLNTPIVTYCAIGHRGAMAMMTLRLLGYNNVKSMGGGFNNWVKNGLPFVKVAAAETVKP
jgi:rhodanese-related sulfurtransferase